MPTDIAYYYATVSNIYYARVHLRVQGPIGRTLKRQGPEIIGRFPIPVGGTRFYMRSEVDPLYDEQLFRLQVKDFVGITEHMRDVHRLSDEIPAEFETKCYKTLRSFLDKWLAFGQNKFNQKQMSHQGGGGSPAMAAPDGKPKQPGICRSLQNQR